jgi:phosphonate transport system permease protein
MIDSVELEFQRRRGRHLRLVVLLSIALLAAVAVSAVMAEVSAERLARSIPALAAYVRQLVPDFSWQTPWQSLRQWQWNLPKWLALLWETVLMAFLGTVLGTAGALAGCLGASKNITHQRWLYHVCRRALEVARTIPELVYALLFVYAFRLGPLAGILAIAAHSCGALGKLFAELIESARMEPVDGLRACGATRWERIRFGILPQVLPGITSYVLLRFEINVRASSVIGLAGVGGIGQEFYFVVRQFLYSDVSAILVLIVCSVMLINVVCESIRRNLIHGSRA